MSIVAGANHPYVRRPPSAPTPSPDVRAPATSTATYSADAPARASSLLDELWLARAEHLGHVQRGAGVVVVSGARKLAEASARSVARAVREATTLAGRSARGATLYLAVGPIELDRGELTAILDGGFTRVALTGSDRAPASLHSLAQRLAQLGIEVVA